MSELQNALIRIRAQYMVELENPILLKEEKKMVRRLLGSMIRDAGLELKSNFELALSIPSINDKLIQQIHSGAVEFMVEGEEGEFLTGNYRDEQTFIDDINSGNIVFKKSEVDVEARMAKSTKN